MADDADLDDFFAKKDKGKKKAKSKFTAGDLLAEQGKDTKKEKKKKSKDKETQSAGSERTQEKEDEEWVEFEDEKDYSGLRIQSLQISKQEDKTTENEEEPERDEDGEIIPRKDGEDGPWKNVEGAGQPAAIAIQQEAVTVVEKIEDTASKVTSGGVYVPPHHRGGDAPGPSSSRYTSRRKKEAPNIQSDFDFPTLGATDQSRTPDMGGNTFEKVRGGGRHMDDKSSRAQLELGNKYGALQD